MTRLRNVLGLSANGHWRFTLPGALMGLTLLALGALYVRGGMPEATPRVPRSAEDGILSQVIQRPGEPIRARAAVMLAHPYEEVWAVLTDYENYGDICAYMHHAEVRHDAGGATAVRADGDAVLGQRMPFAVTVETWRELERGIIAWEGTLGQVGSAGTWRLTSQLDGATLLEVEQEVAIAGAPAFIVRALTLRRLRESLAAIQLRLVNGPGGRSW